MASESGYSETSQDPYCELLERIKEEFSQIMKLVVERLESLVNELRNNLVEIQTKKECNLQASRKLNSIKGKIEDMGEDILKSTKDKWLSDIDEKFEELNLSPSFCIYKFQIDMDNIKQQINDWGKIVETSKVPNYSDMKDPVVAVGKKGVGVNELNGPRGVAYEENSGLIFVCDSFNSMVKMFNSDGDFVDNFGYSELIRPWGILLHESSIYVTDIERCSVLKYHRDNLLFLKRVGKKGKGVDEFNTPGQLTMGPSQHLYLPESENNRISVLDTEFILQKYIQHDIVVGPVDVKFIKDQLLVLTTKSADNLHLLNANGDYIRNLISIGDVCVAFFFTIDCFGFILVPIWPKGSVFVYDRDSDLVSIIAEEGHEKGELSFPFGICTTNKGNMIVVSNNKNYGLQMF